MSELLTIKVSIEKYDEIKEYYRPFFIKKNDNYIDYVAKKNQVIITGFLSNKKVKSITFQGDNAQKEVDIWGIEVQKKKKNVLKDASWLDVGSQIGSDEVGVGDLFLPMIVVAAYVKSSQIEELKRIGITDSKKLNDEKIIEIAPQVIQKYEFSKLTLGNEKYNEMILKGENINSLKAKMHNRALRNLYEKHKKVKNIYIDQFVNEEKYYSYLTKFDEPILRNITFKTKGESYYPSIALASVVARYYLLVEKKKLERKYRATFPYGAGMDADKFLDILYKEIGKEELEKIIKINFKNYKKYLENK